MKIIYLLCLIIFLHNCSKPKTVLICGDHICVNKREAKQFFEENLSIEVRIIDKKNEKKIDLVQLNLKDKSSSNRSVSILSKKNTKNKIKPLSNKEIKKIKSQIKKKQKKNKKKYQNNVLTESDNLKISKNKIMKQKKLTIKRKEIVDICTILKKCSIDEITNYLINEGKKKDFPKISTKR